MTVEELIAILENVPQEAKIEIASFSDSMGDSYEVKMIQSITEYKSSGSQAKLIFVYDM